MSIRVHSWLILLLLCGCAASSVTAAPRQTRAPAEAEALYQQLGAQMTCTCGCREALLDCSHNNCPTKPVEQRFLRELCEDASKDTAAIRAAMADRFGDKILQAPSSSLLYPLLIIGGIVLVGGFGVLIWRVAGRGPQPPPEPTAQTAQQQAKDPLLDARIERELRDLL